jgi:hypothetical protein
MRSWHNPCRKDHVNLEFQKKQCESTWECSLCGKHLPTYSVMTTFRADVTAVNILSRYSPLFQVQQTNPPPPSQCTPYQNSGARKVCVKSMKNLQCDEELETKPPHIMICQESMFLDHSSFFKGPVNNQNYLVNYIMSNIISIPCQILLSW